MIRPLLLLGLACCVSLAGASAVAQQQAAGTIEGQVASRWVWRAAAVVYVKKASGTFQPPSAKAKMDQQSLNFIPHVLPVLKGTTVIFPNTDTVRHNVYSPAESTKRFNLGVYPPKSIKEVTFNKVGVVPLLCNVHAEMSAFIVVLPNPFFAVTDIKGNFTIKKVPPGNYELTFWHERLTPKTIKVTVTAGATSEVKFSTLKRGGYSVKLE